MQNEDEYRNQVINSTESQYKAQNRKETWSIPLKSYLFRSTDQNIKEATLNELLIFKLKINGK